MKNLFIYFCLLLFVTVNGLLVVHFHPHSKIVKVKSKNEQYYSSNLDDSCVLCLVHFEKHFLRNNFKVTVSGRFVKFIKKIDLDEVFVLRLKSRLYLRGPPFYNCV